MLDGLAFEWSIVVDTLPMMMSCSLIVDLIGSVYGLAICYPLCHHNAIGSAVSHPVSTTTTCVLIGLFHNNT